ncbi:hypothetical protein C8J57DRAFT_1678736 [Mycena rebaudengoi]|nr:hypothetical protein C8J57DRAFT_1678736 [Mycena rebaudengoi]
MSSSFLILDEKMPHKYYYSTFKRCIISRRKIPAGNRGRGVTPRSVQEYVPLPRHDQEEAGHGDSAAHLPPAARSRLREQRGGWPSSKKNEPGLVARKVVVGLSSETGAFEVAGGQEARSIVASGVVDVQGRVSSRSSSASAKIPGWRRVVTASGKMGVVVVMTRRLMSERGQKASAAGTSEMEGSSWEGPPNTARVRDKARTMRASGPPPTSVHGASGILATFSARCEVGCSRWRLGGTRRSGVMDDAHRQVATPAHEQRRAITGGMYTARIWKRIRACCGYIVGLFARRQQRRELTQLEARRVAWTIVTVWWRRIIEEGCCEVLAARDSPQRLLCRILGTKI